MLPNKFDQHVRDKLLDHSTKVSPNAWKMIHAGLLRHKAFHFWKWYMAGPTVVLVALTGHLILAKTNKPITAHAGATAHTRALPVTSPARTAAAGEATTPGNTTPSHTTPGNTPAASGITAATTTPGTSTGTNLPAPKTNSSSVAAGTVHKTHTSSRTTYRTTAGLTPTRNQTRHGPSPKNTTPANPLPSPPASQPGPPVSRFPTPAPLPNQPWSAPQPASR